MVYFNVSVQDSNVNTFIMKNGEITGKIVRKTKSTFVDVWDSYTQVTNSIQEALTKISDSDDYSVYITLPSWFSLSKDDKEKWMKGIFGSFPETNNITIDTVSKASLYCTDSSFENRISLVFNETTTGWIKTKKDSRPIVGYGYLINGDPLSLFDLGGTVISFILSSKVKRLERLLYRELNLNDKLEMLNQMYSNSYEGREMIMKIGSRKFLDKMKKEMTLEQRQSFTKLLRRKIDSFVFWLYKDVKSILSEGRVSFAIIGSVFGESKPLYDYFMEVVERTFNEKSIEVKFEKREKDLGVTIKLMIEELKWDM